MLPARAFILLILVAAWGCSSPQPAAPKAPPYVQIATTKQLMQAIIDPHADEIWDSVGTIVTPEGTTEIEPHTDEEWTAVQNNALALAEASNLLTMGNRPGGSDEFIRLAQQLTEQGAKAAKAAEARDKAALFTIGGDIYDVCTNCHRQFMPDIVNPK